MSAKTFIITLLAFNLSIALAEDEIHSFYKEREKSKGKTLTLNDSQIIKPVSPKISPTAESENLKKMKESGKSSTIEFLFNPNEVVSQQRDPNYYPIIQESDFYSDPNLICPSRPKRLWDGRPRKLFCRKDLIESDTNLKEEESQQSGEYVIKKTK